MGLVKDPPEVVPPGVVVVVGFVVPVVGVPGAQVAVLLHVPLPALAPPAGAAHCESSVQKTCEVGLLPKVQQPAKAGAGRIKKPPAIKTITKEAKVFLASDGSIYVEL